MSIMKTVMATDMVLLIPILSKNLVIGNKIKEAIAENTMGINTFVKK